MPYVEDRPIYVSPENMASSSAQTGQTPSFECPPVR
jgi:hypothetical protein